MRWKMKIWTAAWLLMAFTLSGCLNTGEEAAAGVLGSVSAEPLSGDATLVCSQACVDRAQCGQVPAGENALSVLLRSDRPGVQNHDVAVGSGAPVTIMNAQVQSVLYTADPNRREDTRFYLVDFAADRQPAWVAGWCIRQP